jgi:hypothetical protein
MVFADIQDGTPDEKVCSLIDLCEQISRENEA